MADPSRPGLIRRFFRWLFSPSAKWSVFALLFVGLVLGAVGVIGSQVAIAVTGTNEFCGNACHSHEKFVYPEHREVSGHHSNRLGVRVQCVDCHLPHTYPDKIWAKAKAGLIDGIAEMRGVISTKEKYEAERWRMANQVWDSMRADNSANCRHCHNPAAWEGKQSEDAVKQHKKFFSGKATCIDCHTGIAHKEPVDPATQTEEKPAAAAPAAAAVPVAASAPASAASQ